jgi:hypothetical protein
MKTSATFMGLGWGSFNVGRTDDVPSSCYVTTKFIHVWFLPIIPIGSYLIVEGVVDSYGIPREFPIPFSGKSLLLGWMRAWTLFTAILAGCFAYVFIGAFGLGKAWVPLGLAAGSLMACVWLTFGRVFRHAGGERAGWLLQYARDLARACSSTTEDPDQ